MSTDRLCHDCGVKPGEPHLDGCDTARCLITGDQRLLCYEDHDCGQDVWTGEWPGEADASALGFFCYWDGPEWNEPGPRGKGWVQCDASHPKARPDLNRLAVEGRWNAELKKFVR